MKEKISSLDNKIIKEIDLNKFVFGVEYREDIIYQMIVGSLAVIYKEL